MQTKSQLFNDKKGNYINKTQDAQVLRRPKKFLNIIKWLLKDSGNINTSCIGQTIFYSTQNQPPIQQNNARRGAEFSPPGKYSGNATMMVETTADRMSGPLQ